MSRSCHPIEIEPRDDAIPGEHLLLQELTHRINNELASTIGFIRLTAAQSDNDEVKVALSGVIEHVHDFARIYKALQMPVADVSIDAAGYLRELCQSISRAKLRHRGIELAFVQSPLRLNAIRCWRLGMIVSELIANASRHAFGDGSGGKIEVELIDRGAFIECTVTDNGSGSENVRPGQGMTIIRSLVRDLNGTVDHRSGSMGTCAMLRFPVHGMTAHDAAILGLAARQKIQTTECVNRYRHENTARTRTAFGDRLMER